MHFRRQFSRSFHSSRRSRRLARFCRFGRRESGFTLTELVIAMVVLGVLASIAIPSFLGSRNNSYDKEAQASIKRFCGWRILFIKVKATFLMGRRRNVVIRQRWLLICKNLNRA